MQARTRTKSGDHDLATKPPSPATSASVQRPLGGTDDHAEGSGSDDLHKHTNRVSLSRPLTRPLARSTSSYEAKNLWHAMNQKSPFEEGSDEEDDDAYFDDSYLADVANETPLPDDVGGAMVSKTPDQLYDNSDHLLFGSKKSNVNLSALHPPQVHIFRLWQIYLDNVNPLLKVTHTPILQSRIIDAASDVANMDPIAEALLFGVYCVAIMSLGDDDSQRTFGMPRKHLLTGYQFGCRQALLNCEVLKTCDRECLTALFLYLVSFRIETDPRSLSSMFGVAIRIAERMGIQNESTYSKLTTFEAEMRRRLWWSLTFFNNRICELADSPTAMLSPAWDCSKPLNVNDFELRRDMKQPPTAQEHPTEAVFAVVRSELADLVRHSDFHLSFTNPYMKTVAENSPRGLLVGSDLVAVEEFIENQYLRECNLDNPIQFMTAWSTRGYLAKCHLLEHYSSQAASSVQQADEELDRPIIHALNLLRCDTRLNASPLIRGYRWFFKFYFLFPAYIHIVKDLERRPLQEHVQRAWDVMTENYAARFMTMGPENGLLMKTFYQNILRAWNACQAVSNMEKPLEIPWIVLDVQDKMTKATAFPMEKDVERPSGSNSSEQSGMDIPMSFGGLDPFYSVTCQSSIWTGMDSQGQVPIDTSANFLV
ncbi:MAG: hypothetical protein M1828_005639 [Chrysothrix sp. TS-e1954]|nr:MAG: hypothetical protein M1828_005639 [Chrysothrix sp. TS-e1954]